MPDLVLKCINSWKEKLPDYQFFLWNRERFDINSIPFVKQAFEAKKYAFAADYIRLYAVYEHGGIYLDTDVEVLKSFDTLLHLPYFIGLEFNGRLFEAATFGSEAKAIWLKECLDYYAGRNFINNNGQMNKEVLPIIIRKVVAKNNGIVVNSFIPIKYGNGFNVFNKDFFSPKSFCSDKITITPNTYSIHHFSTSWMSPLEKLYRNFKYKVKQFLYFLLLK